MSSKPKLTGVMSTALIASALFVLVFAGSAMAKLTGEYTKFAQCPRTDPEAFKCAFAQTEGGEVDLGSKVVPIVNTVTMQGGFTKPVEKISKFIAAASGDTLSKTSQPVPGGLLGLVPPEGSPLLIKELVEAAAKNGLTGVNATLELAGPASGIRISESNLSSRLGVALKLPIKIHLENPFLGSNCYVGSDSSPIIWELTSGITSPPPPAESIEGASGKITFLEGGRVLRLSGNVLVDNAWSAPSASGCGGLLSVLVDPVLNLSAGLPAAAGQNSAILNNTLYTATVPAVNENDELNP
jgi:hypothetical protein